MRTTFLPTRPYRMPSKHDGFQSPLSQFGAEQRESLFRGIAFFLVLALSCLVIVYAPLVWGDPDWAAAGVLHARSAATAPFSGRAGAFTPP